ncbi:MAG: triphosphoribosyl-dephospho-CoA synthase [Gammaproteobacteria bacterium]
MPAVAAGALGAVLLKACRLDVIACKPGNVSLGAPAHGMDAQDFLTSARVAVPALCEPGSAVGARIARAIAATWATVGCNTNLGIVLLLAPLAAAAQRGGSLRAALHAVLQGLDRDDAAQAYAAIRQANPGGLGRAPEADVEETPSIDLRTAMGLAAARDSIARQYVTDYADVFEVGVETLRRHRARWRSLAWATTACHLEFMARWPDTHIARKHGERTAQGVQQRAVEVATALKACENPRSLAGTLQAFDSELKTRGVNPGTSADLTVASVAGLLLLERFSE